MVFPFSILILLIVALVISSVGWIKYVYFISFGYGFAIAALGAAMLILFAHSFTGPADIVICCLFIIYGCRLGSYLLFREIKSAAYRRQMPELMKTEKPMTVFVKFVMWISVALLYVMEVSPAFYRYVNEAASGAAEAQGAQIAGAIIMAIGIIGESTADFQKSAAKRKNPNRFCDTGLYRIVRCPNYFSEILFWTGSFVSGIGAIHGWQYLIAAAGYLGIVYIMFGGARRLETRQHKNYGKDPEYEKYSNTTPILIPFIPLYHLEQYTFLKD